MASNRPRDPSEDPDEALLHPSSLVGAAGPRLHGLAERGEPAHEALRSAVTDRSSTPQDRVAAAVLLDALFMDPTALEHLDPEDAAAADSLALRFDPQLRSSAARALGSAITMHLLTWAIAEHPGEPPVTAAEAADRLGIDDDGQIYRRVSQRAVLVDQQRGTGRAQKDQLRRLSDALGRADQQARQSRGAAPSSTDPAQGAAPAAPAAASGSADPTTPGAPGAPGSSGPPTAQAPGPHSSEQGGAPVSGAPVDPEAHPDPKAWTAADDDALAAILGREQPPSPGRDTGADADADAPETTQPPETPAVSEQSPAAEPSDRPAHDDPAGDGIAHDGPAVEGEIVDGRDDDARGDGPAAADTTGAPGPQQDAPAEPGEQQGGQRPTSAHQAPDFGRPVGFDSPRSSHAAPSSDDPADDDRASSGRPEAGSSPVSGAGDDRARSYEFRRLGEGMRTPMTEEQKAEQRTTLRNWGLFAIALVVAIIILAILL